MQEAIKRLIEARFDAVSGADVEDVPEPSPHKRSNGVSAYDETDPSASPEPAKKKAKRGSPSEDADARLAAQLQAQENSLARGRTTRGGGDRAVKKRKAPRKKSSKKVRDDDDSDVNGSGESGVKKRKAGGGFQKPFNLSSTLSDICGETQVSSASTICPKLSQLTNTALPPASRQKTLGTHQGQRPSRSGRQTTNPVRRQDAGCVQTSQGGHVQDEQRDRQPSLSSRGGVTEYSHDFASTLQSTTAKKNITVSAPRGVSGQHGRFLVLELLFFLNFL